jgi:hypothetical protein
MTRLSGTILVPHLQLAFNFEYSTGACTAHTLESTWRVMRTSSVVSALVVGVV